MSEARTAGDGGRFFGAILTFGGLFLQFLGVSGVADSFVRWRSFFEAGVMRHYEGALTSVIGSQAPPAIEAGAGYALSCIGFFIAAFQTMLDHRRYLSQFKVHPTISAWKSRLRSTAPSAKSKVGRMRARTARSCGSWAPPSSGRSFCCGPSMCGSSGPDGSWRSP